MKKITISILIPVILMVCPSISFGQEGMKPEAKKENTVQINISADELNRIMRDKINIDQKLSIDDSKPIMIKISSMPLRNGLYDIRVFYLAFWVL